MSNELSHFPRGKIQMPLWGLQKIIRKTNSAHWLVRLSKTNALCVSSLHVQDRPAGWKPENRGNQTFRIPEGFRFTREMRTLLWPIERNVQRFYIAWWMPNLPESAPVRNSEKTALAEHACPSNPSFLVTASLLPALFFSEQEAVNTSFLYLQIRNRLDYGEVKLLNSNTNPRGTRGAVG